MEITTLVVDADGRPGSPPLTLRPLVDDDTVAVQTMLDDPDVREAMRWKDAEHIDATQFIAAALAEQIPFYRVRYTFGIVPEGAPSVVGVAAVMIGEKEPGQLPPVFQTDLTIFFAPVDRGLGYGRRILARLRDWCFDDLRFTSPFGEAVPISEVTAVCQPGNAASRALLTDLLIPLGPAVLRHRKDGTAINAQAFALTREQHEQRAAR